MKKLLGTLTLRALAWQTYEYVNEHEILSRAQGIAFSGLAAGVSLLTLLITVCSQLLPDFTGHGLPGGVLTIEQMRMMFHEWFPPEIFKLIEDQIALIQSRQSFELFSLGSFSLLMSVWFASSINVSLIGALNCIYGVKETRPWWKLRVRATYMTFLQVLTVACGLFAFLDGPVVMHTLGITSISDGTANSLKWITVLAVLMVSLSITFHMGPNAKKEKWVTPGSIFGAICFVLASIGFRLFVEWMGQYGKIYGSLGGVFALFTWSYLVSCVFLIAAEINRIIQFAAENRKLPEPPCPAHCLGAEIAQPRHDEPQPPVVEKPLVAGETEPDVNAGEPHDDPPRKL